MQPVVSADQVARAYTVPLGGVTNALQYYDQMALRRSQMAEQNRQRKEAEDFKKQQIISNAFEGTDIGTGTPWDEVGHANVNAAYEKVMEFQRKNPNANATDIWAASHDAVKGIRAGIDNAKKGSLYVDDLVKRANAEYPHLDQTALKGYFQQKVFRDDKGGILPAPNTSYTPDELRQAEYRSMMLNEEAAKNVLHKELAEGFKPEPYAIPDKKNPNVIIRGKTRGYLDENGEPLLAPVTWTPPIDPANPKAVSAPMSFGGVPADVLERLKSKPIFSDMLHNEKRRMKQTMGQQLKGATDQQIEQLAAAHLVRDYGSRDGIELPTPDFKIADHFDKKRHEAFMENATSQRLANSNVLRQLAVNRAAKQGAPRYDYVPDILAAGSTLDPKTMQPLDPKAAQIIAANSKAVKVFGASMPAISISGIHGKPLKDPDNGQPVNVYAGQDPVYGNVLIYKYLVKDPLTKAWVESERNVKVIGTQTIKAPGTDHIIMQKGDLTKEMQRFDSQFKPRKNDFIDEWQQFEDNTDEAE